MAGRWGSTFCHLPSAIRRPNEHGKVSVSRTPPPFRPSMRALLLIRRDHGDGAEARAAQELLRPAHRPPDRVRHFLHRESLGEAQPEHALLARRQRAQDLVRHHALDLGRLEHALLHRLAGDDAPLLAPVVAAGVADRADEPGPHVVDVAAAQEADEDVVHERVGVVARHAELARGDRAQQRRDRDVPLFRRTRTAHVLRSGPTCRCSSPAHCMIVGAPARWKTSSP